MKKVLMVCLGNICRSPLAQGILSAKVDSDQVFVDSAGTAAYHVGEQPDERSIAIARVNGIDISNQSARKFIKEDFHNFDHIFVMDQSNLENVLNQADSQQEKNKVQLILSLADGAPNEVPDPYYGGEEGFELVYNLLDDACDYMVKHTLI